MWNDTAPPTSLFSIGNSSTTNASSGAMIAYCFAEIQGYSKFDSYTGNGFADGTFVYTGFKPAFCYIKNIYYLQVMTGFYLTIKDLVTMYLMIVYKPNWNGSEQTGLDIDRLSNGFKLRGAQNGILHGKWCNIHLHGFRRITFRSKFRTINTNNGKINYGLYRTRNRRYIKRISS